MKNKIKEFKIKLKSSAHEIKYAQLVLPAGERETNEGSFLTVLVKNAFKEKNHVVSGMVNPPIFQITVNLNPKANPPRLSVLLGRADENKYRNRVVFLMPENIDSNKENEILVSWKKLKITSTKLNGEELPIFEA